MKDACGPCSDLSDDELVDSSRVKSAKGKTPDLSKASAPPGQLTLLQCGFSQLLETKWKAVDDSDENTTSDNESPDEQPSCLSAEAKDVGCQKNQVPLGTSKHHKLANILNPSEKGVVEKSKKLLEQSISSESDKKNVKNATDHHCILQNVSESEDSDVILPTQYTTQKSLQSSIKSRPPVDRSEDSETENSIKIGNDGDDRKTDVRGSGLISKQLNPKSVTLKSIMERKGSSDISDESDDIDISSKSRVRKQRATRSLRFKGKKENKRELDTFSKTMKKANHLYATDEDCNSQDIDDFSSSDDDCFISHIGFSKQKHRPNAIKDKTGFSSKLPKHTKNSTLVPRRRMKFSNESIASQEQMYESMDRFLGNYRYFLKTLLICFVK